MKTPEEIKRGLAMCSADECHGQHTDCPYHPELMCIRNICADAIAMIQQLEAQVPKWISVEERLPEKHGQIVVGMYNQHGDDKSILFPHVFTWHAYGENGYVKGPHFSDEGLDGLKVYYWMPMPEPPKEEEK